ncbi:MAG: hypothetical protein RLZZ262_570 [Bacteroidota bacterium]
MGILASPRIGQVNTMAIFRIITLGILFSFLQLTNPSWAINSLGRPVEQKPAKKQVDDQPNMDGVVEVSFKIDGQGKIQIVDLVSTSPQLSEYVLKKLAKIQINEQSADSGKVIKYRFTFKKQT